MSEVWTSLQDLTEDIAPSYTKAVIQAGLRSPQGERCIWIVVEDVDDVNVYERFFQPDITHVLTSENEDGNKGCSYVEEIVTEVLAEENNPLIFGIRDTDYTRYETPAHQFPPAIFTTDHRDVEMMMLAAPSVQVALNAWHPALLVKLEEGKPVTRMMGYIRLCNHIYSLGCNFKKKVKISKLWDNTSHSLITDWESVLMTLFLNHHNNSSDNPHTPLTEEKYHRTIEKERLDNEDSLDICQGHDTIRLLQYMMVQNLYNETNIMRCMTNAYEISDFQQTELCNHIRAWEAEKGVNILRGH